jgi:hypothetical protein
VASPNRASTDIGTGIGRRSGPGIVLVLVVISALSVYVALLTNDSFGDHNDDAIYLTTAKALATGQGYRIISLPSEPLQTKYPPLFPALLSLVWRLYPSFPANLTAMISVTVLASIASSILAWLYLTSRGYASRWVALAPVGLAAVNIFTAMFSTGVFPEMPYMALSIGALWLAESRRKNRDGWSAKASGGMVLGALMGLAFLTRVTGVTIVVAVGLYFIVSKGARKCVLPLVIAAMFIAVWVGWCHYNHTTTNETNTLYFTDYLGYASELIRQEQADNHHGLPAVIFLLIRSNALQMLGKAAPRAALGYYYDWLGLGETGGGLVLASIYGLALILILVGQICVSAAAAAGDLYRRLPGVPPGSALSGFYF